MPDTEDCTDLEKIVAEMRRLGVKEYTRGDLRVVLGEPTSESDDKSDAELAHIRSEREASLLAHKRRMLLAASPRVGPAFTQIK